MDRKLFYNNPVFRLAAPLLFGILIYLLILMFFDSVEMLAENFFSREVLFVVGLTLVFFEVNRLIVVIMNRMFRSAENLPVRALIQYFSSFLFTSAIVSLVLYGYFVNIEGFTTIRTELITFNALFLTAALFYHLYYFSILFLFRKNEDLFQSEQHRHNNLQLELTTYKNQINPEFLFQTLEIIIRELHRDKKKADDLIDQLAKVYRYTLDTRNDEVVLLEQELASLQPVLAIFQSRYPGALRIHLPDEQPPGLYLVPGTLMVLFEHAAIHNLVGEHMPLDFRLDIRDFRLHVRYPRNERIALTESNSSRIEFLKKNYDHLSSPGSFVKHQDRTGNHFEVPLIPIEEE